MGNLVLPEPHDIAHEDDLGYLGLPGPYCVRPSSSFSRIPVLVHVNLACSEAVKRLRKLYSQALSADVKSVRRIHYRPGRE